MGHNIFLCCVTFIDAFQKRYEISSDTEIEIVNRCNNNKIDVPDNVPIKRDNYKDALLPYLYTQVEYYKSHKYTDFIIWC